MSSNKKIAWSDSYSLGINVIDIQHKKLFDLVNRLYDLKENKNILEELRIILYEFSDYTRIHLKNEEAYMASIDYPDLEEHKKIHKSIIQQLSKIIHKPASLSIIQTKMRVVAKRILVDHITQEDIKIKRFEEASKKESVDEEIFDISDIELDN